jgi:hypothetical protein
LTSDWKERWRAPGLRSRYHSAGRRRAKPLTRPGILVVGAPHSFLDDRLAVIEEVNTRLREKWSNGGLVFACYDCQPRGNLSVRSLEVGDLISALTFLGSGRRLPPEIAGCSTSVLSDGGAWPETPAQFANGIFGALRDGGFYTTGLPTEVAEEMTRRYLEAFFGPAGEEDLLICGCDLRFSVWFFGDCDFAFLVYNHADQYFAIVLATDTD